MLIKKKNCMGWGRGTCDIAKIFINPVKLLALNHDFVYNRMSVQRTWTKGETPRGVPGCPKDMDNKEETPRGVPGCPKDMDNKEETKKCLF